MFLSFYLETSQHVIFTIGWIQHDLKGSFQLPSSRFDFQPVVQLFICWLTSSVGELTDQFDWVCGSSSSA